MSVKNELKKSDIRSNFQGSGHYELIIIGAGISGLSTGLVWLKNTDEKNVLMLEKNSYPGGYVTAYKRGDYIFETTQLFPDVIDMLEYLDIDLPLRRFEGNYMRSLVVNGDEVSEYKIPVGPENFTDHLMDVFPSDAKKIKKFMDYSVDMFTQVSKLKALPTLMDMVSTPFLAPKVIANLNKSFSQFLDTFGLIDPRIREVFETFNAFSGIPPDRASAIVATGSMLASMTRSFRTWGYFDEFPALMAKLYQQRGGELGLKTEVDKIIVKNGEAVGVRIKESDHIVNADRIVTTCDPMFTMRRLVGDEHLPSKYIRRLRDIEMSNSAFNVALGLDDEIDLSEMDLDYPFNVLSTGSGSMEKLHAGFKSNKNVHTDDCFHAAVICPSLTTGSKNTVTINVIPFAMANWKHWRDHDRKRYDEEKERWANFFIEKAEKYFIKDLRKHIVVKDISTPATYARYSGSPTGAIFDMATTKDQFGPKRLPMKTPIKNLFQPKFAHGIFGGMMNGLQVTDLMLDRKINQGNSLLISNQ
jgi:phytoene dehydrogenase-like protein